MNKEATAALVDKVIPLKAVPKMYIGIDAPESYGQSRTYKHTG